MNALENGWIGFLNLHGSEIMICECNVYICKKCGRVQGDYHGSINCIGREYLILECDYCMEE